MPPIDRRARTAPLLLVLAAHGLLLGQLNLSPSRSGPDSRQHAPERADPPPVQWLLMPGRTEAAPPRPRQAAKPGATRPVLATPAARAALPAIARTDPQAITVPALPLEPPPAASSPPPLQLELQRHWRDPAAAQARPELRAAPRSLEAGVAWAMGGDARWEQERLAPDRVRLRRGRECVELRRPMSDATNPFSRAPWMAQPC